MTFRRLRATLVVAAALGTSATASSQQFADEPRPWAIPPIPDRAANPSGFVPAGWKSVLIATGDLNRDRRDDIVALMRMTDPSRIVGAGSATDPKNNTIPYLLVVGFRDGQTGYRRVAINRELVETFHGSSGEDVSSIDGSVAIQRGAVVIQQEYIRSHETFRFRWDGHDFALIGFECGGVSGGTYYGLSANYATRRAKIERGPIDQDKADSWTVRIKPANRPTLNNIDLDQEWIGEDLHGEALSC